MCKNVGRIFVAMTTMLILMTNITGCAVPEYTKQQQERPHLYWKDIDVVITDIQKRHWFAVTHWYAGEITVHSEEYGMTETIYYDGTGSMGEPNWWNYEKGDAVMAEMDSWVMDSTGEVVKRKIVKIY